MERNVRLHESIGKKNDVVVASFDIDRVSWRSDAADRFESASRESRFGMIAFAQSPEGARLFQRQQGDSFAEKKKKILNFFRGLLATATVTDRGGGSGELKE